MRLAELSLLSLAAPARIRRAVRTTFAIILAHGFCLHPADGEPQPPPVRAEISGVITDISGASIPGALVSLSAAGGNFQAAARTSAEGAFRFPNLEPGNYRIEIAHFGFKQAMVPVSAASSAVTTVNIRLELDSVRQQMTVTDQTPQVSTQAGGNLDAVVLDSEILSSLPAMDDDIVSAISRYLDPSATAASGISLVVDGMETTRIGVTASAIKEVRINQNPFSAEFSRPGRGRIEIITKEETTRYHGSLTFRFRDYHLDARNPFAQSRPEEQRRAWEGSLVGPLGKSARTSFVISAERQEEDLRAIIHARAPSALLRQQFFTPGRENEYSARINHRPNDKSYFSLRYEVESGSEVGGVGGFRLPETAFESREHERGLYFKHQRFILPTIMNEFQAKLQVEHESEKSRAPRVPQVVVQDAFTTGGAQIDNDGRDLRGEFSNILSWSAGRHFVRAGFAARDLSRRSFQNRDNRDGVWHFASLEDYLAGRPFSFMQQLSDAQLVAWQQETAAFLQDDFRFSNNLSVAFGLRYERYTNPTDSNNLAPRLSLAWAPGKNRRTVIRAGAGIFYDNLGFSNQREALMFDGRAASRLILTDPGYPDPFAGAAQSETPPPSVVRLAPDLRTPYLVHGSLGVEHQVANNTTLAVTYGSTTGWKMFRSRDVNAPFAPGAPRPDPRLGVWRQIESSARLSSHSLQASLRGNLSRYFDGMVRYSIGRTMTDTSGVSAMPANNRDLRGEWSRADFDRRHQVDLIGTLNAARLFKLGMALSLESGRPYTITTGRDDNGDGFARDRPAGIARNTAQGPGEFTLDVRWSRDIPLRLGRWPGKEKAPVVTFALDAFNVLNRVNYKGYVGNLSSPFFGGPVAAAPARRIQVLLRFKF